MQTGFRLIVILVSFALSPNAAGAAGFYENETAEAAEHHPIVPAFERFADVDFISDVERGRLLINELNCQSCHAAASETWSVSPKQAPILTEVGQRVLPRYLERFLLDPHGTKPGTTMPDLLAGKPATERAEIAESLAHFLASTSANGALRTANASNSAVAQGETLFHNVGCVACHNPQNDATEIATSVPLGQLEQKYTLPSLTRFIANPLHTRPSGRMPKFNLTNQETESIAAYLLRKAVAKPNLKFDYYEGSWEKLPDFKQLTPKLSGLARGFDIYAGPKEDEYGIVFSGFWTTTGDQPYTFRISSDDGAKVYIDGVEKVENDGLHAMGWKSVTAEIPPGIHEVRVEFFEKWSGEGLEIEVSGNGLDGVSFETLLRLEREESVTEDKFVLDLAKAKLGRQHFQTIGCANCHELTLAGQQLATLGPATEAAALAELTPDKGAKGCLDGSSSAVQFGLTEKQIASVSKALTAMKNDADKRDEANNHATLSPAEQLVHEKLATHNCYACHNRDFSDETIRGGVVDMLGDSSEVYGRKNWFTGTQIEMGDEGQHPPVLTSIGSKLNPAWLKVVFTEGVKSRPYMNTRMPMFGESNLGSLAIELIAVDWLEAVPEVVQTEPERDVKSHGRFFAGEEALSCIKCHRFGEYDATGIQAIDLTTMTERLNKDWFHAYMRKPSRFRRGTRMPESWPGGKSFYPDVLDGDTDKQIDAIWQFLADGTDAAKPVGLVRAALELKAIDHPKMYRNFIEGAGPRAIGVGYPEQVNLAFDAELCRMALVWQENFIDASRHWIGRGQGFEKPLGENVLELPAVVPFALERLPNAWPETPANVQFKGYRFDAQRRPTFLYQIGDVLIEDQPLPAVVDDRPLLKRRFKISSTSTKTLFYLAAPADSKLRSSFRDGDRAQAIATNNTESDRSPEAEEAQVFKIDLSDGPVELEQFYDW